MSEQGQSNLAGLTQYPRVYSMDARTQRALDAIATAPLGLVIGISVLDVAGLVYKALAPSALAAMGFFAGICALLGYQHTHRRVILYEDAIEVSGWFSSRKLTRSEILGYRRKGMSAWQARGGNLYIIFPADKSARVLRLPSFLHTDKDFFSWMEGIPKTED